MTDKNAQILVLLRGINVGGRRKVPMAELRHLAELLGYTDVRTYIASGNLLLRSGHSLTTVGEELAAALEDHFGFAVDLVLRTRAQWMKYAQSPPFADAGTHRPKLLHLGVAAKKAPPDAQTVLQKWCQGDERVAVVGDAVWIDYANGVGRSGISPARLDRAFGCPVTGRNYHTVQKLATLLED